MTELEHLKYKHVVVCWQCCCIPPTLLLVSFKRAVVNRSDWTAPNTVAEWTDMTKFLQGDLAKAYKMVVKSVGQFTCYKQR